MTIDWCKQEGDAQLLVEGQNDCHVTLALCKKYDVPPNFGIYECGNDARALKRMNALIAGSDAPKVVGLVLDADSPNLAGRWSSIQGKLSAHKLNLPATPNPDGTILEAANGLPRLGFWLMPNNRIDGMLEDFCCEMIDADAIRSVEQGISIAEANGHSTFKTCHRSKAVVHTYLAWQDEPGRPLGQAITAQTLRPNTPSAEAFVNWLITLFRA